MTRLFANQLVPLAPVMAFHAPPCENVSHTGTSSAASFEAATWTAFPSQVPTSQSGCTCSAAGGACGAEAHAVSEKASDKIARVSTDRFAIDSSFVARESPSSPDRGPWTLVSCTLGDGPVGPAADDGR